MIDPAYVEEVVPGFFEAIRSSRRLPKTISLRSFEADPIVYSAMLRCLASTGRYRETSRWERPFADLSSGTKKTGKNSKKRKQDWSKLSAIDPREIVHDRTAQGVAAALETFLAIELASWKGEQGTALLCDSKHARFVRRLIGDLAAKDLASVALLRVSGKPIAAQVMLHCGRLSYMWKPTHDRNYARYSPGALLCARVTDDLLQSGQATLIDSCSSPNSFMAQLWSGRRTMVDALLDIGPRNLLVFWIEIAHHRGYQLACLARDRFRAAVAKPKSQKVTGLAQQPVQRSASPAIRLPNPNRPGSRKAARLAPDASYAGREETGPNESPRCHVLRARRLARRRLSYIARIKPLNFYYPRDPSSGETRADRCLPSSPAFWIPSGDDIPEG